MSNLSNLHVPVVIVGAGPTGLAAGNLLGQAGIETLILEQSAELCSFPRAIAIDDEGLRICQALGLGEQVLAHTLLDLIVYYRSNGRLLSRVAPTTRRNGYPFVSTFYQPEFEDILFHGLQRFPHVHIRFQHSAESFAQQDNVVTITVRATDGSRQEISCDYLLACDGGKSVIRRLLNIPMRGATYAQRWLVIDAIDTVDAEGDETSEAPAFATFYCDPQRPAMTILSPGQRRRWEFMLLPGETDADMLKDDCIQTLIRQTGYSAEPRITRKVIYTFHAARANAFSHGRVFLLGDAAHLMPPFGGQGMNSGLRDAHNLCWKLAMVLRGQAQPSLLATYQTERTPHVAAMIRFSTLLGAIIMPTRKSAALLRDAIFRTLNAIPLTRAMLSEGGIKPAPRYPHGALVPGISGNTRAARKLTGILLPQPEVTCNGQRVLLDDILGPGFALLRYHQDPTQAFAPINTAFWQKLGTRLVCVQPAGMPPTTPLPAENLYTVQTEDAQFLRMCKDLFIVVRPDRFIMGVFEEKDANEFMVKCQKLLNGDH